MRKFVLGAVGAIAMLSSANAADIYVPAPAGPGGYKDCCAYSWAGYYVGINAGGTWMHNDASWSNTAGGSFKARLDDSGAIGGGQFGRNWQFGSIVLGLETDFALRRLEANATGATGVPLPAIVTLTQKEDWLGTVRGRLGYAMNNWLFYGTGGFAYGDVLHHVTEGVPGFSRLATDSKLGEGWAAGGGIEWAINPRWSVGAEYLHVDLGNVRISQDAFAIPGTRFTLPPSTAHFEDRSDIVRAKLNYHFPDYTPLK